MKIWYLITASPMGGILPGGDENAWADNIEDPDQQEDGEEEETIEDIRGWINERKINETFLFSFFFFFFFFITPPRFGYIH